MASRIPTAPLAVLTTIIGPGGTVSWLQNQFAHHSGRDIVGGGDQAWLNVISPQRCFRGSMK